MEQYNYNYNYDDINEQNGLTEGPNSVGMSTTEQIYNTAPVAEHFYVQPVRTTPEEPRGESLSPVITLGTKLTAPRGKRNDSNDNFEWKKDLTYYFIDQLQTEPCLYNVNDLNFHLKDKRMSALSRILESMSAIPFRLYKICWTK